MSGQESFLLYFALLLALFAGIFSGYLFFDLRRRVAGQENTRTKYIEQLNNEMQSLKREHGHLNDAVARFRAQSLAGISETINESINEREKELGLALKESLEDNLQGALSLLSKEFDVALEAIVERVARLEKRSEPYDGRADVQLLGRRLEQLEVSAARTKDLKVLGAGQVIDRFLASLDNPDERFRCLLASFDSVSDSATLGKLAVAYPGKNSWIILKELADHGVVSEVAAWAMIAGARLSLAAGDDKSAQNLYQGARAAFVTCGGNHDGLWAVNTALARLTEGEASDNYNRDAMANLFALKSNTAQSTAPLQLAEFYQREDRLEVAAVLLQAVAELHLELDSLAYQSSLRVVQSLGQVLLQHYQANVKNLGEEKLFSFMSGALTQMRAIYTRCPSLEREAKVGLLVTMLYLARLGRDADGALHGAGLLMDQCQAQEPGMTETMATDFADKIFKLAPSIYESLLVTLDALELSRKWRTMPLLARLTAAFMDTNNLSKASSCGAKLVDCALESHGDASVETISPIVTLAQVYRRMQRLDLVEECYRQILEIQYKVFSSESEEIVETLISLSDICRLQNNNGEADIFLESAIETGEELVRKEKSSDKLVTLLNRARTLKSVSDEGSVVGSDTNGGASHSDDEAEAMPAESEESQAQHAEQHA